MRLRLALVVVAGCLVYANGLAAPFVFDDRHAIVNNLRIRELWPGPFAAPWPILELTFALNYAAGGLATVGYHATNLLLHVACALLIFDLARRLVRHGRTVAVDAGAVGFWTALLFVVHPLQTEAVTYVGGRDTVLSALWYLATLELFVLGEERPGARRRLWAAAVATCALGMASGRLALTAPLAVFWLARCVLPWPSSSRITFVSEPDPSVGAPIRWPVFTALAATASITVFLIAVRQLPVSPWLVEVSPLDYLRGQLVVSWRYLQLALWPVAQSVDHDWALPTSWASRALLVPAVGWAAILALLGWLYYTDRRVAAFWIGFMVLALAPTSSLLPEADDVSERRMYLGLAGLAALCALAGVGAARRWPRLVLAAGVAVVVALGTATVARNQLWRDPVVLLTDALAQAPTKIRIFRDLTQVYEDRGDPTGVSRVAYAEVFALTRLRIERPYDPVVLVALGDAYARLGQMRRALRLTGDAVRITPTDPVPRVALGRLLLQDSQSQAALEQLEIARALVGGWRRRVGPDVMRALVTDLGLAYAAVGRTDDAARVLQQAVREHDAAALNGLGLILGRLQRWEEAREVLARAYRHDPSDPVVQGNLGWVYGHLGRLDEAAELLEAAAAAMPQAGLVHANLGWVRVEAGEPARALPALERAQGLMPDDWRVAALIGVAHARLERWSRAIRAFERALVLAPRTPLVIANLARARQRQPPLSRVPSL